MSQKKGSKKRSTSSGRRVRLSGVYSTPLRALLTASGFQVADGDDPDTTIVQHLPHHRGVAITGAARDAVADTLRDGLGGLVLTDYVEMGNIYRGEVMHLLNEGAIIDLDVCEGYLPYKFTQGSHRNRSPLH